VLAEAGAKKRRTQNAISIPESVFFMCF